MYLEAKTKVEEANRILKERERTPEPAPAATGKVPRAEDWASQGDDVAARLLLAEDYIRLESDLNRMRRTGLTEDEETELLEHFRENRFRLGDLKAAKAELIDTRRAKTLAEENEALKAKLKQAEINAEARGPNVIRTAEREVTASRLKGTISRAQFDKDQKGLSMLESLKQQQALLDGHLRLDD